MSQEKSRVPSTPVGTRECSIVANSQPNQSFLSLIGGIKTGVCENGEEIASPPISGWHLLSVVGSLCHTPLNHLVREFPRRH